MVLADDDVLLRESLASLLDRSGLEVVGQVGDAAELMELVGRERPDLAVVDIRMPPKFSTEGLEAARVIQRDFPQTAVMVLSAHVEVEHAMDLLANGQRTGYLLKSRVTDIADFVDALKRVERGGSAIDPALVQELVAARRDGDRLGPLTARERGITRSASARSDPVGRSARRVTRRAARSFISLMKGTPARSSKWRRRRPSACASLTRCANSP